MTAIKARLAAFSFPALLIGAWLCISAATSAVTETRGATVNFFTRAYRGTRTDFTGNVGYEFIPAATIRVTGLGRSVGGRALAHDHQVTLWDVSQRQALASRTITAQTEVDANGFAAEQLPTPLTLEKGRAYRITSREEAGGDPMVDISTVEKHLGVARITTGVYTEGDGYPAAGYGGQEQGYGLPTFYFDPAAIDQSLLTPGGQAKPFVRDLQIGYLLQCSFSAPEPYSWKGEPLLSGWEVDKSGGTWDYQYKKEFDHDWFKLIDNDPAAAVTLKRQIARQSEGQLTLEYRFKMPKKMDGVAWELCDFDRPGVSIVTADGNLCWTGGRGKPAVIQSYEAGREYGIKVVADITAKKADVYVDGFLKSRALPFASPVTTIDYVQIKTGDAATGELFISPVNIYKGYVVNETFVACNRGGLPTGWTATGENVNVDEFHCRPKPDVFSLRLEGTSAKTARAKTSFAPQPARTICEFRFLLPEKKDGVRLECGSDGKPGITICASDGNLCYGNGDSTVPVPLAKDYRANLWYMIKLVADSQTHTADIYINGKLAAEHASFPRLKAIDSLSFSAPALMWIDDVQVYPWRPYPADYVPEPKPAVVKGSALVGVQSCNLWREGTAYAGWEYVYPYRAERKPYLGWYDEGDPEETDWEIKWQVEHGISYEMHCWYRPSHSAVGHPIKDGDMDQALIKGLFNARYSHLKKFAIMYTNDNGGFTTPDDFRQNLVPYWIEYFFKDPRYLKLDGKPVICLYDYRKLAADLGGADGVKSAVQYLRDETARAGFPGTIILGVYGDDPTAESMRQRKAAGFDAVYAYCWFTPDPAQQQKKNLAQRDAATAAGLDMIPGFGMGWDAAAWGQGKGPGWASKEDYRRIAQWMRDEFVPSQPARSAGRRLIILDNWCEFGEGHFIMPSPVTGFGYLDALRDVFTEPGPHEDLMPTDQQKSRFTVRYPRE